MFHSFSKLWFETHSGQRQSTPVNIMFDLFRFRLVLVRALVVASIQVRLISFIIQQVRVMYQLGSVRCFGQTVNCRVKAGQPSSRCSRVTGSGHRVKHET
ncbi:hypothetical protein Hanom_Chr04g00375291 [Helianthus anomalus]